MNKNLLPLTLILLSIFIAEVITAQLLVSPKIIWQKTVGGTGIDSMASFAVAADKSIVLCGSSNSGISGDKSEAGYGGYDFWVVKMNANGNIKWNKTFGGKKDDIASAIIATSDGGYLVGGTSISDRSATKTANSFKFSSDFWIMKLNADGIKIWDKTYGGIFTDRLTSLAELPSGKYVVGGFSFSDSSGAKTTKNVGTENNADYWMVTLNIDGNIYAQNVYGGLSDDVLSCVSPAGATGIYAAGNSYSPKNADYKKQSPFGNNDYWIVRTDLNNKKTFEAGFGGDRSDYLTSMQVLNDNSAVFGGYSNSTASFSKTNKFLGVTDFWLLKMDAIGTKQWDRTIGGKGGDYLVSVQQTKDKGFILGGYSDSDIGNNKTENSRGGFDYWIVKTDKQGREVWDKTFGGSRNDKIAGIYEVDSAEYIIAGTSQSGTSGDKTNGVKGGGTNGDFWILKINEQQNLAASNLTTQTLSNNFEIITNPVNDKLSISYSAKQNSNATFSIYSAEGKMMQQATVTASANINTYDFNIGNLANGTYYIVMLSADGNKISKTFIKQ